jgi:hypothetical protein
MIAVAAPRGQRPDYMSFGLLTISNRNNG